MPLVFQRTTVDKDDIPKLDEGECLNDNIITFGLRYLSDEFELRHKDLKKRVFFHNSFFYEKLKLPGRGMNYEGVKNWTAKVDILACDYIVVPVNEYHHWWVAIICNPGLLDPDAPGQVAEEANHGSSASLEDRDEAEQRLDAMYLPPEGEDVEMTNVSDHATATNSPRGVATAAMSSLSIVGPDDAGDT